jgi:hypothetical protein
MSNVEASSRNLERSHFHSVPARRNHGLSVNSKKFHVSLSRYTLNGDSHLDSDLSTAPENHMIPRYPPPECVSTGEIHNSNIYNRSFCLIEKLLNYDEARQNCAALGMKLFTLTTSDDIEALVKYSEKRWTTNVVSAHVG